MCSKGSSILIYLIRHAAGEMEMGTWKHTKAVYNYIAPQARTTDALRDSYRNLLKNTKGIKALEEEIKQGKWVKMQTIIKQLLLEEVFPVSLNLYIRRPAND
jgi:hypothetical protein